VNEERFDDLTRALATSRISRWQVLKTFGAVAALGFLETLSPLRTPFAVAASCPNKNCTVDPEDANNLCTSCTEVEKYIESTGVKGAISGKTYPGWVGVTEAKWKVKQKGPPAVKGPYRCSCKAKGKKNELCYKGKYKFEASVENEDREIRWVPNPPVPKRCKTKCDKAITAWCKKVDKHEQRHVRENNKIVKEANKGNAKFADLTPTFVGCANTTADAKKEMQKKAQEYTDSLPNKLDAESQKRGKKFHGTPAGRQLPPPCKSCQCSETCGGVKCSPGEACCNGKCVNTQTDSNNCGTCGKKCATGQACKQGQCVGTCGNTGNTCPAGQVCCNGQCVDTTNDRRNCGGCGNTCNPAQDCKEGQCTNKCNDADSGPPCYRPDGSFIGCCDPGAVCCTGGNKAWCCRIKCDPDIIESCLFF